MAAKRLFVSALVAVVGLTGCSIVPLEEDRPTRRTTSGDTVTAALSDVERFWTAEFGSVSGGDKFTKVQGGYFPYSKADPPPSCGGQQASYEPNAFYCPPDDFIAWDAQQLIPELENDYGPLLVGVVIAHEYGHAIQTRLGDTTGQPTVVLEQQADCYAGAWLSDVLAGKSTGFKDVTPAQLDDAVAGVLTLRDQPGTPAQAEGAHGNAFDRIRALQDGVEEGVRTCAGYNRQNLPVTEVPFTTREDAESGGNLAYDQAVSLLADDAQAYWQRTYPQLSGGAQWADLPIQPFRAGNPPDCPQPDASAEGRAFYCPDGDFVAFDSTGLGPALHQRIGDFALGMLMGDLFARAAQDRRGEPTRTEPGQLTVDCLAGSWTNDLLTRGRDSKVTLSPGDLDEAVQALLAFGRAGEGEGPTAFDRIAAYREGTLKGLQACTS
ncbi:aminopeptidase [Paractinoplanes abujensis]|uniref:Putative metalloprotease n=1 Tax=Paractinoplanes abujensis TaxID=882441 RepID=A0A7W7FZ55_9ACTN|nr:neutral zinc metallopeptidase [Actinoplanes abujensis]MBB4691703.1 putative metalloprotease [Actinoplanes abujensis]GID16875.1 aminopeptidase [Actinoplanes abujensis]